MKNFHRRHRRIALVFDSSHDPLIALENSWFTTFIAECLVIDSASLALKHILVLAFDFFTRFHNTFEFCDMQIRWYWNGFIVGSSLLKFMGRRLAPYFLVFCLKTFWHSLFCICLECFVHLRVKRNTALIGIIVSFYPMVFWSMV
jgi:hypothetical protein